MPTHSRHLFLFGRNPGLPVRFLALRNHSNSTVRKRVAMSEQLQAGDKNGQVKGSEKWIRAFRNFCFAKNAKSLSTPILPYVIAATGKRNLSEDKFGCSKGQIACTFKHFLKQIIKQWQKKAGKNTPLILMTGLYEGVDQIITETALNMQKEFSCLKVMAVMPQKENDFSKRFNN